MANDPERLEQIAQEAGRRERAWRSPPAERFGAVLARAPSQGALADDEEPPPRPPGDVSGDDVPEAGAADRAGRGEPARPPVVGQRPPLRATVRGPDPRAWELHAQLDARPDARPAPGLDGHHDAHSNHARGPHPASPPKARAMPRAR